MVFWDAIFAGNCGGVESLGLWALILDKQSLSRKWLDDTLGTKIVQAPSFLVLARAARYT